MKRGIFVLSIFCLFLGCIAGCGYTTRSLIADKYSTIYVDNFINKIDITREGDAEMRYKIYKPTLEVDITRAIIDRLIFDGNLKPVKIGDADLTLKGELVAFDRDPLKYTNNDEVAEYRINVRINMVLKDNKADKELWRENNFTGSKAYFTTGPYAQSDDSAVHEAVVDLGRRVVERIVEEW